MDEQPAPQPVGWLNRTVFGIGLASLLSDAGHEMATTAMPALMALIGAGPEALGLIEGIADGLASFVKLLSGHYSDRLKRRKPLAVAGYFLTAAGMASFALATVWWHVLLGRSLGWFGRGARAPVKKVLLTEATTPATYGRAFGFERAMDTAGAVVGPLATIGLLSLFISCGLTQWESLKWIFALTLLPGIAAALAIGLLVREREHTPRPPVSLWVGLRDLPSNYRAYLLGVGIAGLGDYSNTFLIFWATLAFKEVVEPQWAAVLAMGYYVGYNFIYMISCYVSGLLADRYPQHRVLAVGYALAILPAIAILLPLEPFTRFGLVFALSGVYMGVWETVESTTAAVMLPKEMRGAGFGLLATVNGVGDLLSSIVVGALWAFSPVAAMGYVIVLSLTGAGIIARLPGLERPAQDAA